VDVSDWKCTLLFYIACTYVKALGMARGKDIQDHFQLRQWLNTTDDLWGFAKPYRKLEERSRDARYEGRFYASRELADCGRWFSEVRDAVVGLLRAMGVTQVPVVDPSPWL
jgi:hypothetical protein